MERWLYVVRAVLAWPARPLLRLRRFWARAARHGPRPVVTDVALYHHFVADNVLNTSPNITKHVSNAQGGILSLYNPYFSQKITEKIGNFWGRGLRGSGGRGIRNIPSIRCAPTKLPQFHSHSNGNRWGSTASPSYSHCVLFKMIQIRIQPSRFD